MSELQDLAAAAQTISAPRKPTIPTADATERLAVSSIDAVVIFVVAMVLFVLSGKFGVGLLIAGEVWLLGHLVVEMVTGYTLGSKLVRLRTADSRGEPAGRLRLIVRGLVRHLWLWLMFIATGLAVLVEMRRLDLSFDTLAEFQVVNQIIWLVISLGSLLGLRGSSRTLSDLLTGTVVLSDRRIALVRWKPGMAATGQTVESKSNTAQ